MLFYPGGFSYGDYLRAGALARFSKIMNAVEDFAQEGRLVIGICNGFQILLEYGLLSGGHVTQQLCKFICQDVFLKTVTTKFPFPNQLKVIRYKFFWPPLEGGFSTPKGPFKGSGGFGPFSFLFWWLPRVC